MKQVKIDEQLFIDICIYFLGRTDKNAEELKKRLKPKILAYIKRTEYTSNKARPPPILDNNTKK